MKTRWNDPLKHKAVAETLVALGLLLAVAGGTPPAEGPVAATTTRSALRNPALDWESLPLVPFQQPHRCRGSDPVGLFLVGSVGRQQLQRAA